MIKLLTSAQMRALETAAIARGDVTGLALMERAGRGVFDAIMAKWPAFATDKGAVCVLCGPGNNGGDGFVIARLFDALGWDVRVHMFGDPSALPPDAKTNHDRWCAGHDVLALTPSDVFEGPRPDVIVDAVFGIGLTRPLPEAVALALDRNGRKVWKAAHAIKMVAVDCPSGLNLDQGLPVCDREDVTPETGLWPKTRNIADLTVTFHAPKVGHYLALGPRHCGTLKTVDIGLPGPETDHAMQGLPPDPGHVRLVAPGASDRPLRPTNWPVSAMAKPGWGAHKYGHGHVVVFAGGVGRGGAGRLAARAALRVGAGLVTVVCPPSALIENACQLNAIMLKSLGKDAPLIDVADHRVTAFCMGPGMGVSQATRHRVAEALDRRAKGTARRDPVVVLDADALTSFEGNPSELFDHTHSRTVLTPHEGEFRRLFPDLAEGHRDGRSKVDVVREAAELAGCIVLLKGPDTVIAGPGGGASVHCAGFERAAPWLATAGAGDVLAGLIAGLCAPQSGGDAFCMTEIAAYLHVEAARSFGPGLIAEDLPEEIPTVFRAWGL